MKKSIANLSDIPGMPLTWQEVEEYGIEEASNDMEPSLDEIEAELTPETNDSKV